MAADPRPLLAALVADDEALARHRIIELLRGHEGVRVIGETETGPATLAAVRALEPDLVFLDVQMPGLGGFDVLARLAPDERPMVIFSTAYDEYALAAFEVHAVDYLLKPFSDERFAESLRRAEDAVRTRRDSALPERLRALLEQVSTTADGVQAASTSTGKLDRFAVRDGERHVVLEATGIDWIESAGDYVRLHAGTDSHLVRATMASLERRLDPARFLRIHRSTIVQVDRVRHIQVDDHGEYVVTLRCGQRLRVGRSHRSATLQRLGVHLS